MTKVNCPECDKTFRTETGLNWHLEHIHAKNQEAQVTSQESGGLSDEILTEQPVARLASEQQVSMLEDRLQKLERVTGLRESDWDDLLGDTEPLTNKLISITEQLSKLSDTVSKLSQDVGLSKVTKDADRANFHKRVEEVERKSEDDLNSLAAAVNIHRDSFNRDLAALESRIDKVQKAVQGLDEGLTAVRTKLATHGHDDLKPVPELVAKVGKIEQTLGSMQSQVDYLGRVAKRWPTGNMVQVALTDGKEHTFREYKSSRGLTKPHKSSTDLFLGSRWVDLTEPED